MKQAGKTATRLRSEVKRARSDTAPEAQNRTQNRTRASPGSGWNSGTRLSPRAASNSERTSPRVASKSQRTSPPEAGGPAEEGSSSAVSPGDELSFRVRFRPFRLGLRVDNECKVTKLDIGGQAHTMGVREGWIVSEVAGTLVGSAPEVTASFEACRKRGRPFTVQFRLPSPSLQPFLPLRPPRPPENAQMVARTTVADIIDQGKAAAVAEEKRLKELV